MKKIPFVLDVYVKSTEIVSFVKACRREGVQFRFVKKVSVFLVYEVEAYSLDSIYWLGRFHGYMLATEKDMVAEDIVFY